MDRYSYLTTPYYLKRLALTIVTGVLLVVAVVEIWLVNRLSTTGYELRQLESAKHYLSTENLLLQNEVDKKSSLNYLEQKALDMGFKSVNGNTTIILPTDGMINIPTLLFLALLMGILGLALL